MGYSAWGCKESDMTERLSIAQRLKDEYLGQMETCLFSLVATARVGWGGGWPRSREIRKEAL